MRRCYLMRCLFLVDRNKRHTATITRNTRMETGRKGDSRIVQIVRFVRTAVRRFPLMRCIFRVDRSCIRVVSLSEYWTCMDDSASADILQLFLPKKMVCPLLQQRCHHLYDRMDTTNNQNTLQVSICLRSNSVDFKNIS